ncbi:serine/threonine kinase with WD-40 repeat [Crocosphaera watsonii WH 0402]|uniref:Serine/threonine kinase with WD-40 repeat n=2 Tax=Crocosphaera watsonii TaxID=263511 RepID=T2JU11_CROWT|nr:serine/threonine kinase with WD-40 repeat [Crocosphaera watsonii WH 0003]CCQ68516.1 serine/threonine kinase with WD-40 repeat [Crocosphaera watsonii WH 0402]
MVISADGKTLVSGSGDNTIKVWNLATGELLRTLNGHSSYVSSVSISADRNTIVSGSGDNTIKVWSLATGKLLRILNGHSDWVNSVAISADGKTIVSGSRDTRIKVWRLKQREFDQEDQDRISSPLATIDKSEI